MKSYSAMIIQIARMGDLVQTLPLIRGLQFEYGEESVALLVDKKCVAVAEMMVKRENIFEIDSLNCLDSATNSPNYLLKTMAPLLEQLDTVNVSMAINLNFHPVAAALLELVRSDDKRGARLHDVKKGEPSDSLLAELFAATVSASRDVRHISDIWLDYAETASFDRRFIKPLEPQERAVDDARVLLSKLGIDVTSETVAILPGAGLAGRAWQAESYASIAQEISRKRAVLLIGSPGEFAVADEIANRCGRTVNPIINLCGGTDLSLLAGMLYWMRLVVGVDTGPLHLAAALGTQCAGIYYGSMFYPRTGPYGDNHIVIVPRSSDYPCREEEIERSPERFALAISPSDVTPGVNLILDGDVFSEGRTSKAMLSRLESTGLTWIDDSNFNTNSIDSYRTLNRQPQALRYRSAIA